MVERNLLREGFIFNTRTPLGTISGSQQVSSMEIDALFDNNIVSTALVVTGTEFISLDADLGVRWKLRRIELYTDETQPLDFDISISDNNLDFTQVTMTGSAPLWVGDLPDSTVSGAPRYLRYEHRPSSNVIVREWKAVSDDSLVEFGNTGQQTSIELSDAPIGQPSTQVTPLTLFNRHTKPAEAFAFVDDTDNEAENEIEISTSVNGPWVGRRSPPTVQPDMLAWQDGIFSNTRTVPATSYHVDFADGSLKSWAGLGTTVSGFEGLLRGVSTNFSPLVGISNDFIAPLVNPSLRFNFQKSLLKDAFTFAASDVDTVRIRARVLSSIPVESLVEGPRLFWRTADPEPSTLFFRPSLSTTAQVANSAFTGQLQDFYFDVGNIPTWSGTIRAFGFQPFIVSSGTGFVFDVESVDAFQSNPNAVSLEFLPVSSGTFAALSPEGATVDSTTVITLATRNVIMQDCVITEVAAVIAPSVFSVDPFFLLIRPNLDNNFPFIGNNFTVIHAVRPPEGNNILSLIRIPVFWGARKGDIVAVKASSPGTSHAFTSAGAVLGDSYTTTSGTLATTLIGLQNRLNTTDWTPRALRALISYKAIPSNIERLDQQGPYSSLGTYTTPVFESELNVPLNMVNFSSEETSGSSIDSLTEQGIKTIEVRASDFRPQQNLTLGQSGTVSGTSPSLSFMLNESEAFSASQTNFLQLNTVNGIMTSAVSATFVQNVGTAILYHEVKDELWVLNNTISGTSPFISTDARPSWDVFNPHSGEYKHTQHVTGDIFYSYQHPNQLGAFEPLGFTADYGREEIYIFQRAQAFFVGAGSYFGLVLDLEGNFKDVFWRNGAVGVPNNNRLNQAQGFTYAPTLQDTNNQTTVSGIFFTINANTSNGVDAILLTAYRNGDDANPRGVQFIQETPIINIPQLAFATGARSARGIVYNPIDNRLYLYFEFVNSATVRNGFFFGLDIDYDSGSGTFQYTVVSSGSSPDSQPVFEGFSTERIFETWFGAREREISYILGIVYVNSRDTYSILQSYTAKYPPGFPIGNFNLFDEHYLSFLTEVGAGSQEKDFFPLIPNNLDGLWGSVSGTLDFQSISPQGINFPPGRYSQVRYQLNANAPRDVAPRLTSSALSTGLSIGTIPASGTRDMFLRTNIPSGKPVGDQQGRIKAYWSLEEE